MLHNRWFWLMLALVLGSAGVALIVFVTLPDTSLLFPDSVGLITLTLLLLVAIYVAAFFLVRETMRRIGQGSAEAMRSAALAEHHRFLRRLDHELKNPLTALRAGLASLALTLTNDDDRKIVETLADEAQRLSRLVGDLRKLAELEAVKLDLSLINMHVLCQEIAALAADRAEQHRRDIRVICVERAEKILVGDIDLLLLAVHNLLDNALKYTNANDSINITMNLVDDELCLRVSDSGSGIAPAEQALVWEELYRGKNASGIPGSGIGLALVKTIAQRHDGRVELISQPQHGTCVLLYLPLT